MSKQVRATRGRKAGVAQQGYPALPVASRGTPSSPGVDAINALAAAGGPGTPSATTNGGGSTANNEAQATAARAGGGITSPVTTVIARAEQRLRGTTSETLAETWDHLKELKEPEWADVISRIREYEAQGPAFGTDWKKVLSAAVREEFRVEYEYAAGAEQPDAQDLFDGKYDAGAVIERVREIVSRNIEATKGTATDNHKLRAAAAVAAYIRDDAVLMPTMGMHPDALFVGMRRKLAEHLPGQQELQNQMLKDAEVSETAGIHREYMARLDAVDPTHATWLTRMKAHAVAALEHYDAAAAPDGRSALTIMEIAQAHSAVVREIQQEARRFRDMFPSTWKLVAPEDSGAAAQGASREAAASTTTTRQPAPPTTTVNAIRGGSYQYVGDYTRRSTSREREQRSQQAPAREWGRAPSRERGRSRSRSRERETRRGSSRERGRSPGRSPYRGQRGDDHRGQRV